MSIITQKAVFYVGHIEHLPHHFCFDSQGCFVFDNDTQRHENKGTQQIAEHRQLSTTVTQLILSNWYVVREG